MSVQDHPYEITDSVLRRHNGLPYKLGWTNPALYLSLEDIKSLARTVENPVIPASPPVEHHVSPKPHQPTQQAPEVAAASSTPAASDKPQSTETLRREERERTAPWLGWAASLATLTLAGLFFYKGLAVKSEPPANKSAANVPAAATKEAGSNPQTERQSDAIEPAGGQKVTEQAASEPPAVAAPVVAGETFYYGREDGGGVPAWAAEARLNPDYDGTVENDATAAPQSTSASVAAEPAAAPVEASAAEAEKEPSPAPETPPAAIEPGVTAYYGVTDASAEPRPWAAPATVYGVEGDAPSAESVSQPEAADMTHGDTAYFAPTSRPDAEQPWAAAALPNPDYATEATPEPETAASPSVESVAGVTAYYPPAETADSNRPWAAPATVYLQAAAPSPAASACHDSLAGALKTGTLNFPTSSWDILSDSYATLDKIARLAKDCEGVSIEIGGHTDNTGSASGNLTLSELRAKAIVKYLVGAGVDPTKLTAVGYGQDKPVASNDTVDGRRQNRRIEFTTR